MVNVTCDRCGKEHLSNAYDIQVTNISNPAPMNYADTSDLKITSEPMPTRYLRFILCEDCARKMGFPNIYTVHRTKELSFRDLSSSDDE